MSSVLRSYLVAYDINDDKRRSHVAKRLKHYGERLQYSVFLLNVRPSQILKLQQELEPFIAKQTDSVVICPLGAIGQAEKNMIFLGRKRYSDLAIPSII